MCNSLFGVSRFTCACACAILNYVLVVVMPYYLAIPIQNRVAWYIIYYIIMGSIIYLLVQCMVMVTSYIIPSHNNI